MSTPCPDCGSLRAFSIYEKNTYCHKCHTSRRITAWNQSKVSGPRLTVDDYPKDATYNLPLKARNWFAICGISEDLLRLYKVQYSEKYQSVVIPVHSMSGKLVGFVTKPMYETSVKYRGSYPKHPFLSHVDMCPHTVVIVEDIRSAMKVGQICPSIALLGTSYPGLIALLAQTNVNKVVIWLDGDAAGRRGTDKLLKDLSMAFNTVPLYTEEDPKTYSISSIICKLAGV